MNQHSFIAALTDTQLIEVSGAQRHEYLHGQLTVATKGFNGNTARMAAHCDFKGKMFSASVISEYQDSFLMAMHTDAASESLAQLKKYGVFSKVNIDLSHTLSSFGVVGKPAIKDLSVLFPEIASSDTQVSHLAVTSNQFGQAICFNDVANSSDSPVRYLCHLTEKGVQRLHDITDDQAFASVEYWNVLEIAAGIANIQALTVGQFVPQMLNFQFINAIDFDKGCYMGQEVVARTKFLGKNKRACFLLKSSEKCHANAGDNVEIQIDDSWRRGGVINRTAFTEEAGFYALAVMPNDTNIGSVVRLKETGAELLVAPMPYVTAE